LKLISELGIDLGTTNLRVFRQGKGIILNEPTVAAIIIQSKKVLGIGQTAREMIGRTPGNISAVRPLRDGVIADYTVTCRMLEEVRKLVLPPHQALFRPTALVSVPSRITNVERRAVVKALHSAGFGKAVTIEEPMAAALGAGLVIDQPGGNMVVNIGGGTTDIAVISLGGIVIDQSIRVAGNTLDAAIIRYIRATHGILIGEQTAEDVKLAVGSAYPLDPELVCAVKGRDVDAGLPRTVDVSSVEIRDALEEPIRQITDKVCDVLEDTPPELSADIIEKGIVLTGGSARLRGMDRLLSEITQIPVRVADNADLAVALGLGTAIRQLSMFVASGAATKYS
jgi:rod shape-determining protein MreB and related proteins